MPLLRMIFWALGTVASLVNGLAVLVGLLTGHATDSFVWVMALYGCGAFVLYAAGAFNKALWDHRRAQNAARRFV